MSKAIFKVGVFGVLILPSLALASTVSVNPATLTVNKGDMFSMTIGGTGFTVPPDAGGINLAWDPTILSFGSFKLDPLWAVPPSTTGTLGIGTLTHIDFFDNLAPTGPFTIGTISFTALAAGVSALSITEDSLNPWAGNGAIIPGVVYTAGSVTVNGPGNVPEPRTAVLVAGALAFIALSCRRRRHSA